MNPDADASDLFPDFSPVPQMVFVNDSVSLQTEADQRVILVHGVVYSHYSREDHTAEAYALVSLLKMVAYQIESDLLELIRPHYKRVEQEGRTLIQTILYNARFGSLTSKGADE